MTPHISNLSLSFLMPLITSYVSYVLSVSAFAAVTHTHKNTHKHTHTHTHIHTHTHTHINTNTRQLPVKEEIKLYSNVPWRHLAAWSVLDTWVFWCWSHNFACSSQHIKKNWSILVIFEPLNVSQRKNPFFSLTARYQKFEKNDTKSVHSKAKKKKCCVYGNPTVPNFFSLKSRP